MSRLSTTALLCALVLLAPASSAFGWGEVARQSLPDLTRGVTSAEFPDAQLSAAKVPTPTLLGSGAPTGRARALRGPLRPIAVASGPHPSGAESTYVVSQSESFDVEGYRNIVSNRTAADWLALCGYDWSTWTGQGADYLYTVALIAVSRVDADGTVTRLRTFLSRSETGIPGGDAGNFEKADPPTGLAVDRTAGAERLYVSVPGAGVMKMEIGSGVWAPFVTDNQTWVPNDYFTDLRDDGEGDTGPVGGISEPSVAGCGADKVYGQLWAGGPAVPSHIAVDPSTRSVVVAEQTATAGANADRSMAGRLQVREFAASDGQLLSSVNLNAVGRDGYPAPTGLRSQTDFAPSPANGDGWLLGSVLYQDELDARIAGMQFTPAGDLLITNQWQPLEGTAVVTAEWRGQIVRLERGPTGFAVTDVDLADADSGLPFGPVLSSGWKGIEALTSTATGTALLPSTSSPGLLEVSSDGAGRGLIGAAFGEVCGFANDRLRLATRPDGHVLLLQQPAGTEAPQLIRLDPTVPKTAPNGCPSEIPDEVVRTDPEMRVYAAQYTSAAPDDERDDTPFRRIGGWTEVTNGDEVEIDEAAGSRGVMFSVRATDEDNGDADFPAGRGQCFGSTGASAFRIDLAANGCVSQFDEVNGQAGTNRSFFISDQTAGLNGAFRVNAVDDEGVEAQEIAVTVKLADTPPPEARLSATPTAVKGQVRLEFSVGGVPSRYFKEWRIDHPGANEGDARPADAGAFLPAPLPSLVTLSYPVGNHVITLTVRSAEPGVPPATATAVFSVADDRQGQVVRPQGGPACETPLGIPLAQLGLGDEALCVPADPCDVNTQELGLTRLPIVRPASCAGDDAGVTGSDAPVVLPTGSRPTFLARALTLTRDRRIATRIRCGAGPTVCAGRVRIQLVTSGSATTIGSAGFSGLEQGKAATVQVRASSSLSRRLRRIGRARVRVTVTPSVPTGFTRPRTDTKTVRLTATTTRTKA